MLPVGGSVQQHHKWHFPVSILIFLFIVVLDHNNHLCIEMYRLCKGNLTINLKKSRFCSQEIRFLGHIVSRKGIRADPDKTEAVGSYPVPTNLKEAQMFLPGIINLYSISKRLPKCQTEILLYFPSCPWPSKSRPSILVYTNASDTGLGAVLTQKRWWHWRSLASRILNRAEKNYAIMEKEHYLECKLFTVITDHSALKWANTTSRLIRWSLRLQHLIVDYRKAKLNKAPGALSRIPLCCLYSKNMKRDECISISLDSIQEEQHKEQIINQIQ